TRFSRDWSSDVCSSDLARRVACARGAPCLTEVRPAWAHPGRLAVPLPVAPVDLPQCASAPRDKPWPVPGVYAGVQEDMKPQGGIQAQARSISDLIFT